MTALDVSWPGACCDGPWHHVAVSGSGATLMQPRSADRSESCCTASKVSCERRRAKPSRFWMKTSRSCRQRRSTSALWQRAASRAQSASRAAMDSASHNCVRSRSRLAPPLAAVPALVPLLTSGSPSVVSEGSCARTCKMPERGRGGEADLSGALHAEQRPALPGDCRRLFRARSSSSLALSKCRASPAFASAASACWRAVLSSSWSSSLSVEASWRLRASSSRSASRRRAVSPSSCSVLRSCESRNSSASPGERCPCAAIKDCPLLRLAVSLCPTLCQESPAPRWL
mmetsp:Transcript_57644/g.185194  ORF Transcript_57644/g.185194 Transcript_57644/m.185194 type:complete len:287 (+) Transcript_57644:199-1059(+)